ncbi:uncharacterized protein LOC127808586 [Diospyros lotus]|uniref:uncharacterized protein LOC127808586 n=1 Tax=Diospyros lotus TaxID=55363 RepID=UPI00224E30C1|nr:uncharacterized protein LOC127808586 [Diospyros lotus]
MTKFVNTAETRFQGMETKFQNQEASIRNLEVQVGQIAKMLSSRPQGSLPSNTETNPREQANAIMLRSGKELQDPPKAIEPVSKQEGMIQREVLPPRESYETKLNEAETTQRRPNQMEAKCEYEWSPKIKFSNPNVKPYMPPLPFPQRLKQHQNEQFAKFFEMLKKLHINIPFVDAITQVPSYAKFLKDILANKRKLAEFETVKLSEECSAIVQNKLPQKLKDPGSFTIPCIIGDICFDKVLCDLGASINLMPLTIFRKLGLGEPKPTTITLQLADRSIKHPKGIVEDVLVKVDKFIFPVDFIVLDMIEDLELATGKALIDVQQGQLVLRVQDDQVTFNVFQALKHPIEDQTCYRLDVIDCVVHDCFQVNRFEDPLEGCLVKPTTTGGENDAYEEIFKMLEANSPSCQTCTKQYGPRYVKLERPLMKPPKPSIEEPPSLELKPLPSHLKYAFLEGSSSLPVIISFFLTGDMEIRVVTSA